MNKKRSKIFKKEIKLMIKGKLKLSHRNQFKSIITNRSGIVKNQLTAFKDCRFSTVTVYFITYEQITLCSHDNHPLRNKRRN